MKCIKLVFVFLIIITAVDAQKKNVISTKPSFGVMLNEDGDFAFVDPDPHRAEQLLRANVDGHAALGIRTYVFSLGAGSDVLYYPTKVASSYGWRETKYEKENETWRWRVSNARNCIAAGMDAVRIAGEQAKKNNLLFIPSMRMNDSHFMADPFNYPLTGKFWLDHAAELTIKESPVLFNKDYGNLLDYSNEKVRAFRLAVINEAIDRNKKLMDGFELDFNRVQVFFPKGKAEERKDLMTELIRQVRKRLDAVSKETGRPMHLFVRIPPSDESCAWAGLDVYRWIREELVDLVSPAQLMTLAHDMPIQHLAEEAHKYKVQVYPSIYPRTSYRVQLKPAEPDLGLTQKFDRMASVAETLGAVENYRWMGVDGFYLYNYKGGDMDEGLRPHPEWMYALVASMKFPQPKGGDKVFAITKSYYNDQITPSYAYVKQLPRKISGKETFHILLGELPEDAVFPLYNCVLRVGIKSITDTSVKVMLNGRALTLFKSADQKGLNRGKALAADMAAYSLVFPVDDLKLLLRGENIVQISGQELIVTDVEIGYAYYNQIGLLMLGKQVPKLNSLLK